MREADLLRDIRQLSVGDVRLFRANCGAAWTGEVVEQSPGRLVLRNPRLVRMMMEGVSDLIGWKRHVIVPRDVGSDVAIFSAVECKGTRGKPTPEQVAFLNIVYKFGGLAGVAYSVEDARTILRLT